ncbi:MAG: hypothetical protein Q4B94_05280, partial [Pseudomonadota bacterium]|nr:hypothetical protein [Pseudomonadota bacterium]
AATGYNFGERANVEAKNDDLGEVTAGIASTTTKSVVNDDNGSGRDQANGVDAVAGGSTPNVTVTPDLTNASVPVPAGFTLNTDGTITVASTVGPDTYQYPYTICLTPATTPTTCHSAVATIVVKAPAVHSLSGKVYWKQTVAGVEQAGEHPIANNEVKLVGCAAGPDGVVNTTAAASGPLACSGDDVAHEQTVQTSGTGEYSFANIPRGRYHVNQTSDAALDPYLNGVTTAGTDAGGTATAEGTVPSQIRNVLFDSATSIAATGYNFGERANVEAKNDNMGEHNYSATNPIVTPSVVADNNGNGGDTANGQPAVIGTNVTLELGTPSSPALTMDPATGIITVAPGTAPGTYTFPYTICLLPATTPATCDTATATVVVKAKADVRLSKTVDNASASV